MNADLAKDGKRIAKYGILTQSVVMLVGSALVGLVGSGFLAVSFLFGSLASLLPNLVFAVFAFKYSGARQRKLVAQSFSQGLKFKLAMTMIIFVVAFALIKVNVAMLFVAYAITVASHALAMFRSN